MTFKTIVYIIYQVSKYHFSFTAYLRIYVLLLYMTSGWSYRLNILYYVSNELNIRFDKSLQSISLMRDLATTFLAMPTTVLHCILSNIWSGTPSTHRRNLFWYLYRTICIIVERNRRLIIKSVRWRQSLKLRIRNFFCFFILKLFSVTIYIPDLLRLHNGCISEKIGLITICSNN